MNEDALRMSTKTPWKEKKFGIYVLGAGFSCAAGLPLAGELWSEVLKRVRALGWYAGQFEEDLSSYLEFKSKCYGDEVSPEKINFEDFLGFLIWNFISACWALIRGVRKEIELKS
jgi:hypothetical protein